MTPIERQILLNQRTILYQFHSINGNIDLEVNERIDETNKLLNPKESEEPCCDMDAQESNGGEK